MSRKDGRDQNSLREVKVVYEELDRVDGSARFAFGSTECLVSVSGPVEVRLASENPSQATLEVLVRPLASLPGTESKSIASTLKSIFSPVLLLSRHPRTLVQLVGQALCGTETGYGTGSVGRAWNASLIAALINATTAALLNAGSIPMKGVVCAVSVGVLNGSPSGDRTFIVDPSETELPSLSASGCFAFMFSSTLSSSTQGPSKITPSLSLIWTNFGAANGLSFSEAELKTATDVASKAASQIWIYLKESIANIEKKPFGMLQIKKGRRMEIKTEK